MTSIKFAQNGSINKLDEALIEMVEVILELRQIVLRCHTLGKKCEQLLLITKIPCNLDLDNVIKEYVSLSEQLMKKHTKAKSNNNGENNERIN